MPKTLINLCALLIIASTLSGCGLWKGFTGWTYRKGEGMPVYGGADNRCTERFFCFGKKKQQRNISPARGATQAPQSPYNQQPNYPTQTAPHQQPQYQGQYQPQANPNYDYQQQGYAPQQPQYQPQQQRQVPQGNYATDPLAGAWRPDGNWDPAKIGKSVGANANGDDADQAFNQMRAKQGLAPIAPTAQQAPMYQSAPLKDHEEFPVWKHKLDESPYNELIRNIDSATGVAPQQ